MLDKVIRDCILLTGVGVALVAGWTHRPQVYAFLGLQTPQQLQANAEAQSTETVMPMVTPQKAGGSTVTLFKARDGHFWAEAASIRAMLNFWLIQARALWP